nr:helix-turn-helix domain-containing protein [Conexibacter arvalis]
MVETAGPDAGALILRWGTHHLQYANRLADCAIQVYGEERERWARSADALRAATVRELLDGAELDLDVASRRLNYELRRAQLALVVWADPGGDAQSALRLLEAAVADAAAAVGAGRPLVVADGVSVLWAWVSPAAGRDEEAIAAAHVPPGVHVAAGRCGHGEEGFRASHLEAVEARRFALRMRRTDPVVRYRRVELPALLTSDPERARGFVAEQLGPLAGDDAASAQLRETLLSYLEAGMSKLEAANRLSVHQHTVANRLRRAEELLGRSLSAGRVLELHAALALRRDLGTQRRR